MFYIGPNCKIHPSARFNVRQGELGEGSVVGENVVVEGNIVEIGREAFLDRGSYIGGGSCFSKTAFLLAGDWFHMGMNSHINTAMGVKVGESFGFGVESKIFTHGCYLDSFHIGAPSQWGGVEIGDNVWMPNAWVNPGVKIGDNVIISARSLVNTDVPSGSLFGGIPGRVIELDYLPKRLSVPQKTLLLENILGQFYNRHDYDENWRVQLGLNNVFIVENQDKKSFIDIENLSIEGNEYSGTVTLKDQLRRNGIRFKYSYVGDCWHSWGK